MIPRIVLTATLALCLAGLLGACGPGNTLSLRGNGDEGRIKTLEAALQKAQDELKALERKQLQSESRLAELQKRLGASPEAKTAPAVPQASALGVGFARPAAGAPTEPGPAEPAPPQAAPATGETPAPPVPASAPAPDAFPPPAMAATPASPAPAFPPAQAAPTPAPTARAGQPNNVVSKAPSTTQPPIRPRHGRVGAPEPATPEAAIAADRTETPAKAEPSAQPAAPSPAAGAAKEPAAAPDAPAAAPTPVASADKAAPGPEAGKTASPAEKTAYNAALQLAINGHQAEAKAAFEQFMAAHPQSTLAPNALYWIGEGAYQRGEYQAAIEDFDKVAKGWPGHHKTADALYKKAQSQEKAGDTAGARATLERYLKEFPNAELAGAARQKLQALPR